MTQSLVYKLRIDVQSQNLFLDNPIKQHFTKEMLIDPKFMFPLAFIKLLKFILIKVNEILTTSAKLATESFLKITEF